MPRSDFSKTGVILFTAGVLCASAYAAAAHFAGREAGRFLVWESGGGLSSEVEAGWGGPREGIRRSVPLVLGKEMNPLKIRLTFRRPKDSRDPQTVYYKSRLVHKRGNPVFQSKGIIRFGRGRQEVVKDFPAFVIPESGEYILLSQFKDSAGSSFESEAVAALRRNVWSVDGRVVTGLLALTAVGAGFLISGKRGKNGSAEV